MVHSTTRIIVCPLCGRPVLEGHSCRCRPGSTTATDPRADTWVSTFTRARAIRVATILPSLTAFLVWSAFTPAVMVRAVSLAVCCALLILLVLPAGQSRGD